MKIFECNGCGGSLREEGRFYVCEYCGTKYLLGRDDEGQPFTYQPVEKKSVECGQMGVKSSELEVSSVAVREIKLKDTINSDVHNESLNIDTAGTIGLVETYIKSRDWEAAQGQINRLLLEDDHCAQAQWYGFICNKKISSEKELISRWSNFTEVDKTRLDAILSNSSPLFAKHIIDLMFENAYSNDSMCEAVLSTIMPYAKNELVYTEKELDKRIRKTFDTVIARVYEKSFLYLLTHMLNRDEVNRYIDYLSMFAKNCSPKVSQKYYQMILDVDPGNTDIRKKLVKADIDSDTEKSKCVVDIEGLLKYSKGTDEEIEDIFLYLISATTTTLNKSRLFWDLLGYHSKAPSGLKDEIIKFAFVLLNSSLWEEARYYFNLILSFDAKNPQAYWGLCLARIRAKNEHSIMLQKENLLDCPEFHKCLSLYQAANDTKKVSELMSYTQKQKSAKRLTKIARRTFKTVIYSIQTYRKRTCCVSRWDIRGL